VKKSYQQLTREERHTIWIMKQAGSTPEAVARALGRHRSTVVRELARNGGPGTYGWEEAHAKAVERRRLGRSPTALVPDSVELCIGLLAEGFSPAQIRMTLGEEAPSERSIYRMVEADRAAGGQVYRSLPRGKRARRCRWRRAPGIPNRRDISERPEEAEDRSEAGLWEGEHCASGRTPLVRS
jgi:transposase, IS30 family